MKFFSFSFTAFLFTACLTNDVSTRTSELDDDGDGIDDDEVCEVDDVPVAGSAEDLDDAGAVASFTRPPPPVGGQCYRGPGDVVPPHAGGGGGGGGPGLIIPPGGHVARYCVRQTTGAPLCRTIALWDYVAAAYYRNGLLDACGALTNETRLAAQFVASRFQNGYPQSTCERVAQARGRRTDLFATPRAVTSVVNCSTANWSHPNYNDLAFDIAELDGLYGLCRDAQ